MKKLFFVMVLWFAPASAFAFDVDAANAHHQKAWDRLVEKSNSLIGAQTADLPHRVPYHPKMNMAQRMVVEQVNAIAWFNYTSNQVKAQLASKHMSTEQAEKATNSLWALRTAYGLETANYDVVLEIKSAARMQAKDGRGRQVDGLQQHADQMTVVDSIEDLKQQSIMNEMMLDKPSPAFFCRTIAGTTICN